MEKASNKNLQPIISIIVPVYNGEKYIDSCITRLLKIKSEKEIIVINDSSTDNSINLLEKYKGKIKIINLDKNQGVSYARNLGIKHSKGKYVGFVDVDDSIEQNMFDLMLSKIEKDKTDVCICNYDEYKEKSNEITNSKYNYNFECKEKNTVLKNFLIDKISPAIWDKIYKKEILEKIKFNKNLAIGEDILFCLEIFIETNKISFVDKRLYHYLQQENSVMHNISPKLLQFKNVILEIPNDKKEFLESNFRDEFEYFQLEMITRGIHSISALYNKANKKEVKKYLKKYYDKVCFNRIIKNKYTKKNIKIEIFVLKIFGINAHLLLMPMYKFLRKKIR